MAQLPPDGDWLIQQIGGEVILYHRHTEEEIVRFDPTDKDALTRALLFNIRFTDQLTDEAKVFANFWSGYFYAHAVSLGY